MKTALRIAALLLAVASPAFAASSPFTGSEKITVSGYFSEPYGAYRNLDVTQVSSDALTLKETTIYATRPGGANVVFGLTNLGLDLGTQLNHPFIIGSMTQPWLTFGASGGVGVGTGADPGGGLFQVNTRPLSDTGDRTQDYFRINNDTNGGAEFRAGRGGTPSIDFSNDAAGDYDARLILMGDDSLMLQGARLIIGYQYSAFAGKPTVWVEDFTFGVASPTPPVERQLAASPALDFSGRGRESLLGSNLYMHAGATIETKTVTASATMGGSGLHFSNAAGASGGGTSARVLSATATAAKSIVSSSTSPKLLTAAIFTPEGVGFGTSLPEGPIHSHNSTASPGTVKMSGGAVGDVMYDEILLQDADLAANNKWSIGYRAEIGMVRERELQFAYGAVPVIAMRFDPNGRVGVGNIDPLATLHVAGTVYKTAGSNRWKLLSDRRRKHEIEPLKGSLGRVLQLRGVTFKWNDPKDHDNQTNTQTGMIAQEVEAVFPEWVKTGEDGYKRLSYTGLDAVLVESLKELKTSNDDLRRRNEDLEKNIAALESAVQAIAAKKGAS